MIVDYKLFTGTKGLPDNLLWIAEQLPGYLVQAVVVKSKVLTRLLELYMLKT